MNVCPVCARVTKLLTFKGRDNARCRHCLSLERTRVMALFLSDLGYLPQDEKASHKSVLHFAPEQPLFDALGREGRNENYHCYDFNVRRYRFSRKRIKQHNLCDQTATSMLPLADIILHNHVMEHVACDFGQVLKTLNGRLRPGGVHAFTLPMRAGRFQEDLNPGLSPAERKRRFAQEDHMRLFGTQDTLDILQAILGKTLNVFWLNDHFSAEFAEMRGVSKVFQDHAKRQMNGETVFYCTRE